LKYYGESQYKNSALPIRYSRRNIVDSIRTNNLKLSISRLLFFSFSLLAISSCTTTTPAFTDIDRLSENQGVLIMRVNDIPGGNLSIHKTIGQPYAGISLSGSDVKVIPIKGGNLRVSTLTIGNQRAYFDNDVNFTIEAGKINYIGDFTILPMGGKVLLDVQDESDRTLGEAQDRYPMTFQNYDVVKSIAVEDDS